MRPSPRIGQWIWTHADVARYDESRAARPALEAAVLIGTVRCDTIRHRVRAQAGLSPGVVTARHPTAVIRFDDGLDACRRSADDSGAFDRSLDSAVGVLRRRGGNVAYETLQLDHDAPQRTLAAWAASVRYLRTHALAGDSVWVTSLIAHLREPAYGRLFGRVVSGHVLQVFDTGEPATAARIGEAVRLTQRAAVPFRLGLGGFERRTSRGRTQHRAWFAAVDTFARLRGYQGVWIFPAGRRWVTLSPEIE